MLESTTQDLSKTSMTVEQHVLNAKEMHTRCEELLKHLTAAQRQLTKLKTMKADRKRMLEEELAVMKQMRETLLDNLKYAHEREAHDTVLVFKWAAVLVAVSVNVIIIVIGSIIILCGRQQSK